MTAENFDQVLTDLRDQRPFNIFSVELIGGRRFEIDHPMALVVRAGVAVFISPGGSSVWFDHTGVLRVIGAGAGADV